MFCDRFSFSSAKPSLPPLMQSAWQAVGAFRKVAEKYFRVGKNFEKHSCAVSTFVQQCSMVVHHSMQHGALWCMAVQHSMQYGAAWWCIVVQHLSGLSLAFVTLKYSGATIARRSRGTSNSKFSSNFLLLCVCVCVGGGHSFPVMIIRNWVFCIVVLFLPYRNQRVKGQNKILSDQGISESAQIIRCQTKDKH